MQRRRRMHGQYVHGRPQLGQKLYEVKKVGTGKSFSEVFILASTNPQYDKRLSIELPVQYMKIPSLEHCQNLLCTQIVLSDKTKKNTICDKTCSESVLSLKFSCAELVIQ